MRKIVSFLALLVIAFALPHRAAAWQFSGGSDPSSINIYLESPYSQLCAMKFADSKWTATFTATTTEAQFKFNIGDKWYGNGTHVPVGTTTKVFVNTDGDKNKITGLTSGTTYKITLTQNSDGNACDLLVDEVEVLPTKLSIYSTDGPKFLQEVSVDNNGDFKFVQNFNENDYFVFSTLANSSEWNGNNGINGKRYSPKSGQSADVPDENLDVAKGDNGAWHVKTGEGGTYDISVNLSKGKMTATKRVQPAGPLDFSTNTNPKSVKLVFTEGNGSYDLDFSDGTWSTVVDISSVNLGYAHFNVQVTKSDNTTASYGVDAGAQEKEWSAAMECGTGGTYYQGALEAGKKYLVEVTGAGDDHFKFKFTEYTGPTVYLYKKVNNSSVQQVGASKAPYEYTLYFSSGERLFLATKPNLTTWAQVNKAGVRYNPANDAETGIPASNTSFSVNPQVNGNKDGVWLTNQTGKYTITVDWTNQKLSATCEVVPDPTVFLPLTSADFDEPHYFLVGERMGEWHLQPEWELKKDGDDYVLNNRFIYVGSFAVAKVSSFDDYKNQVFQYYGNNYWFKDGSLSAESDKFTTENTYSADKGDTRKNPSAAFFANFESNDDKGYYQGKGKFVKEIRVKVDNTTKKPNGLTMILGTDAEASANRMFALLGDNIYNRSYSNSSGTGNTPMYDKSMYKGNGWQEGWIQYDPATNRPYVDARGEYLYHTSFTPDYMLTHPVQFNQELPNGGDFVYNSSYAQFVEYNKLTDLDSDPYKEFYKAFENKDGITNDVKKTDDATYNFTVSVDNGELSTPKGNWSCYVVRDMWIAGEIKFWTGWGGNDDTTRGGTGKIAVWHGPNGGPNIEVDGRWDVKGFDINSNQTVKLYRNGRNINNANYVVSKDNKPVYFNRVVLWYNEEGEVGESFMQFIQESAGPAILAQPMEQPAGSPEPGKKNYIQYHWYLNKVADGQDEEANRQVLGYEIRRYRIVDGKAEPIGYPEGEYVDIKDKNIKVSDLYEEVAGTTEKTAFTTYLDKGMVGNRGFAPGLYQYDIYVTYEGGARKLAVSNQVPIYGEIAPDAVPMQLVELRGAYDDAYGDPHASAASVLNVLDATTDYANYKYMTYRVNSEDNFYVIKSIGEDGVPAGVKMLPKGVGAAFFAGDNQDKYWWTSNYYLRCLDYNAYSRLIQGYIDAGTIEETSIDQVQPTLEVFDVIIPEGGSAESAVPTSRGNAHLFEFDGNKYYSAVVKRGGNLSDGTFDVKLTYSYTEKGATTATQHTSQAAAEYDPVMPRPFNPVYRYVHERTSTVPGKVEDKRNFGKILVPTQNWKIENSVENSTTEAINKGLMKEAYVDLDDVNFAPRTFTLQVDFFRPNVDKEIYKFYDIHYHLKVTNTDESITKVPLDADIELKDIRTVDDGLKNKYRIEIKGLHPRNVIFPTVEFVKTEYNPRNSVSGTGEVYKSSTGNFGKMLTVKAAHKMAVEAGSGLQGVYLGWIKRSDKTIDWMYKGHKHLGDKEEVIGADKTYEYADPNNEIELQPMYYLIELRKSDTDFYTYPYLVPHYSNHRTGEELTVPTVDESTGLILNDNDPLIGTYIARGTDWTEAPEVHATAIYMFERPVAGSTTGTYYDDKFEFNDLNVVNMTVNGNDVTPSVESVAANAAPARISGSELVAGNAGKLPDAPLKSATEVKLPDNAYVIDMSAADDNTGYNGYIAVRGARYADTQTNENVTGVEDVIADGECGESVYYNMQGMRIEKPETPGVYFRVDGKKVTKFVVK